MIVFSLSVFSQAPGIQWQKCLGATNNDWGYDVIQTQDGGYLTVGTTLSNDGNATGNHGGANMLVIKLDSGGNVQWHNCYGGTSDEEAFSVSQTNDGSYIVTGITNSNDGDVSGNHGLRDYWVVKLSVNGTIQWQRCLGGSNNEGDGFLGCSVKQTTSGDIFLLDTRAQMMAM